MAALGPSPNTGPRHDVVLVDAAGVAPTPTPPACGDLLGTLPHSLDGSLPDGLVDGDGEECEQDEEAFEDYAPANGPDQVRHRQPDPRRREVFSLFASSGGKDDGPRQVRPSCRMLALALLSADRRAPLDSLTLPPWPTAPVHITPPQVMYETFHALAAQPGIEKAIPITEKWTALPFDPGFPGFGPVPPNGGAHSSHPAGREPGPLISAGNESQATTRTAPATGLTAQGPSGSVAQLPVLGVLDATQLPDAPVRAEVPPVPPDVTCVDRRPNVERLAAQVDGMLQTVGAADTPTDECIRLLACVEDIMSTWPEHSVCQVVVSHTVSTFVPLLTKSAVSQAAAARALCILHCASLQQDLCFPLLCSGILPVLLSILSRQAVQPNAWWHPGGASPKSRLDPCVPARALLLGLTKHHAMSVGMLTEQHLAQLVSALVSNISDTDLLVALLQQIMFQVVHSESSAHILVHARAVRTLFGVLPRLSPAQAEAQVPCIETLHVLLTLHPEQAVEAQHEPACVAVLLNLLDHADPVRVICSVRLLRLLSSTPPLVASSLYPKMLRSTLALLSHCASSSGASWDDQAVSALTLCREVVCFVATLLSTSAQMRVLAASLGAAGALAQVLLHCTSSSYCQEGKHPADADTIAISLHCLGLVIPHLNEGSLSGLHIGMLLSKLHSVQSEAPVRLLEPGSVGPTTSSAGLSIMLLPVVDSLIHVFQGLLYRQWPLARHLLALCSDTMLLCLEYGGVEMPGALAARGVVRMWCLALGSAFGMETGFNSMLSEENSAYVSQLCAGLLLVMQASGQSNNHKLLAELDTGLIARVVLRMSENLDPSGLHAIASCLELLVLSLPPSRPEISQSKIAQLASTGLDPFALVGYTYSHLGGLPSLQSLITDLGARLLIAAFLETAFSPCDAQAAQSFAGMLWNIIGDLQGLSAKEIVSAVDSWSLQQICTAAETIAKISRVDLVMMAKSGIYQKSALFESGPVFGRAQDGTPNNSADQDLHSTSSASMHPYGSFVGLLSASLPDGGTAPQESFEADILPKVESCLHELLCGETWNVISVLGALCKTTSARHSVACIEVLLNALDTFIQSPARTLSVLSEDPHVIPFLLELLWGLPTSAGELVSAPHMALAAKVLLGIAAQPRAWRALAHHHGVDVIIRAVHLHHQNVDLVSALLSLLNNIPPDRTVRDCMVSLSSALSAVLDVIESHGHNMQLIQLCLGALRSIVHDSQALAVCFYNDGGFDVLQDCLCLPVPSIHLAAAQLLQHLSGIPVLHAPLICEGVLANILTYLQDFPRVSAEIAACHLGSLANLLGSPVGHSDLTDVSHALPSLLLASTRVASRYLNLGAQTRLIDLPFCVLLANATRNSPNGVFECIEAGAIRLLSHFASEALSVMLPSTRQCESGIPVQSSTADADQPNCTTQPPQHDLCLYHISPEHAKNLLFFCFTSYVHLLTSGGDAAVKAMQLNQSFQHIAAALSLLDTHACGDQMRDVLLQLASITLAIQAKLPHTSTVLLSHTQMCSFLSKLALLEEWSLPQSLCALWIQAQATTLYYAKSVDQQSGSSEPLYGTAYSALESAAHRNAKPTPGDQPSQHYPAASYDEVFSFQRHCPPFRSLAHVVAFPNMLPVYMRTICKHAGSGELVQAVSTVLAATLLCSEAHLPLTNSEKGTSVSFTGLDGIATPEMLLLVDAILSSHPSDPVVAANCTPVILCLCIHKPDLVRSLPGLQPLLCSIFAQHFMSPFTAVVGLWSLFNLASGTWDSLIQEGVLSTMLACLIYYKQQASGANCLSRINSAQQSALPSVFNALFACLVSLARNNGISGAINQLILDFDIVTYLSEVMQLFLDNADVLSMCLTLLCALCYGNTGFCCGILNLGLLPVIIEVMKNFPLEYSLQSVAAVLVGLLAEVPECREAMMHLRILEVLLGTTMPLAQHMASDQVLQLYSCHSAFRATCTDLFAPDSAKKQISAFFQWADVPALMNWFLQPFNVPCTKGTRYSLLASLGWAMASLSMSNISAWEKILLSGLLQAVEAGAFSSVINSDLDDRQRQICCTVLANFPDQEGITRQMREVIDVGVMRQKVYNELQEVLVRQLSMDLLQDRTDFVHTESESRAVLCDSEAQERSELASQEWEGMRSILHLQMQKENMCASLELADLRSEHRKLQKLLQHNFLLLERAESQASCAFFQADEVSQQLQHARQSQQNILAAVDDVQCQDAWTQLDEGEYAKQLLQQAENTCQQALQREKHVDEREWILHCKEQKDGTLAQREWLLSARQGCNKVWERELACLADHSAGMEYLFCQVEKQLRERELACGTLETQIWKKQKAAAALQQETEVWRQELDQRDYEINILSEVLLAMITSAFTQAKSLLDFSSNLQDRLAEVLLRENFIETCEASIQSREEDFVTREMEVAQRLADLSTLEQHQSEREEGLNIRQCRLLVVEEKEELVSRRELHCSVREGEVMRRESAVANKEDQMRVSLDGLRERKEHLHQEEASFAKVQADWRRLKSEQELALSLHSKQMKNDIALMNLQRFDVQRASIAVVQHAQQSLNQVSSGFNQDVLRVIRSSLGRSSSAPASPDSLSGRPVLLLSDSLFKKMPALSPPVVGLPEPASSHSSQRHLSQQSTSGVPPTRPDHTTSSSMATTLQQPTAASDTQFPAPHMGNKQQQLIRSQSGSSSRSDKMGRAFTSLGRRDGGRKGSTSPVARLPSKVAPRHQSALVANARSPHALRSRPASSQPGHPPTAQIKFS